MENSLKNKGLMLKWSVVVLIGLAIALIPANGSFTQEIKLFLVLTAIAMTTLCLELLDVFVVGVMLMLSYVVFGVAGWSVAFSGLTNQTSYVLLGILTMVVVLEETGIMKRVSYYIMSKFGNSYLSVLVGMFIGGIVLNIITFGSCAFFIGAIAYGICKALDSGRKGSAGIFLVTMLSAVAGRGVFYSLMYLAPLIAQVDDYFGYTVLQWGEYLLYMWPYMLLLLVMALIVYKLYKPDEPVKGKAYFREVYQGMGKMSGAEKKAGFVVVLIMLYFFTQPLQGLNQNWAFVLLPWLFFLPGFDLANGETLKKVRVGLVFFVAACLGIGNVATSLGIGNMVAEAVLPMASSLGTFGLAGTIMGLSTVLNFAMTPYAIEACLTLPFTEISLTSGLLSPRIVYYLMALGMDQLLFPYEYTDYLVIFSFGMVQMKEFMKTMGIKMVLSFVFVLCIMLPYWGLLGF